MAKVKRRNVDEGWTEKHGCDGLPPITKVVAGLRDPDGQRSVARRNTNHCTLCRLRHLGHLKDRVSDNDLRPSDMRHAAGEKLQDDYALTGQNSMPSTLNALMGGGRGGPGPAEVAQIKIDADRRKVAALRAVGDLGRFLLEKIVIEDQTLRQVAQLMGVKDNAVLPALRVALDALAQHYGITSTTAKQRMRGGKAQTIHPFQQLGQK